EPVGEAIGLGRMSWGRSTRGRCSRLQGLAHQGSQGISDFGFGAQRPSFRRELPQVSVAADVERSLAQRRSAEDGLAQLDLADDDALLAAGIDHLADALLVEEVEESVPARDGAAAERAFQADFPKLLAVATVRAGEDSGVVDEEKLFPRDEQARGAGALVLLVPERCRGLAGSADLDGGGPVRGNEQFIARSRGRGNGR